ncbi:MAG: stage 0 sporulation family protein [Clostridia bacterium]|nr:stage 0 sporulation family protein [Clostridia bacterium]
MTTVCGVRFKEVGKVYYFDPGALELSAGDRVVVETSRGTEMGEVLLGNCEVEDGEVVQPLKRVLRVADADDLAQAADNREREKAAYDVCLQKIAAHKLDMKLVDVEFTFDRSKILFYFTADGRVDFRELVKDLASVFRTRIELRQIGVRDEAKMLGGIGICGRPFCCASHMDEFRPVSIKMAKEQGLSLNPTKITGTCGRLMCCLKYEQEAYEELLASTPRQGALVRTPEGRGHVTAVNLLRGILTVRHLHEESTADYHKSEVTLLKDGSKKGTPVAVPEEE